MTVHENNYFPLTIINFVSNDNSQLKVTQLYYLQNSQTTVQLEGNQDVCIGVYKVYNPNKVIYLHY